MPVIRVGGATEVEVKEKKDRVDDALNATRAAVEEGIVPGGGVALLRASAEASRQPAPTPTRPPASPSCAAPSQAPIRQIADNAGVEASIVVGKILENKGATYGYNAQTGEYGDMIAMGIIDPAKVVRTALQDAASVAGLLITTEAMIAEAPKKESLAAARRRHGRRHGRHGRHGLLIQLLRHIMAKGGSDARRSVCATAPLGRSTTPSVSAVSPQL